jgi:hypothetical protein
LKAIFLAFKSQGGNRNHTAAFFLFHFLLSPLAVRLPFLVSAWLKVSLKQTIKPQNSGAKIRRTVPMVVFIDRQAPFPD